MVRRPGFRAHRLFPVRRLLIFVCIVVFVDTMLFGVMIPLLPAYVDTFDLSKLEAGVLFGAYGAGAVLGGVPGGIIAARVGPKRAVIAGLIVLGLASFGFAAAGTPVALGVARFVQGFSSTLTWAGALAWITVGSPRSQRGQTLGLVFACAVAGAITGPMFGAIAKAVSIEVSFLVVGALALALAAAAALQSAAARERLPAGGLRSALADPAFVVGLWLCTLPAFFFGVLDVLVPLSLHDAGYGAFAIGTLFVVAGLAEIAVGPLAGRLSDRRGRIVPIQIALAFSAVAAVLLGIVTAPVPLMVVAVVGAVSFASLYAPAMALISDRAETAGLAMALAFGLMNTAWALGVVLGPMLGGGLAEAFGDAVPYVVCSVLAGGTLVAILSLRGARARSAV
jgi:MFS family permease